MRHLSSKKSLKNIEIEPGTAKESVDLPSDIGPSDRAELKTFECANPDFIDFDKEKHEFFCKIGNVLTANDTFDSMPRFMQSS